MAQICFAHFWFQGVTGRNFQNYEVFMSQKIVFVLANSADPDEMPHNAAFHQGLNFLLKNLFAYIQNEQNRKCEQKSL